MRLWSLHPRYLDAKGLVALWRETLLAQAVLAGKTRGYRHHPQLVRFRSAPAPSMRVANYLRAVHAEATARGYRFDAGRIGRGGRLDTIAVTDGQIDHEWAHLRAKLALRDPSRLAVLASVVQPEPHPAFHLVPGPVAEWEVVRPRG